MAFTHQKTVTVTPQNDVYGWAVVDNATNQAANWVTVTQQGSTDVWDFLVADNAGSTQRVATATVTHSNGVTTDSFTITQVGVSSTPSSSPAGNLWNIVTGAATSIFSTGFTMNAGPFTYAGQAGADNNTARGFEWGTDQNNLSNTHVQNTVGTMAYSHDLTGLNASTTYYYRAYSTSPAEGTVYGSIESAQTSAPALTFTEFASYLGTSSPTTPGSTVDESPFLQRIFFKIAASQDLAGNLIDVVSLNKISPSSGAGEIDDFSISNSTMLTGSTINDLAQFEFGVQGSPNNEANLSLGIAEDNKTEGNETYRLTISPDYKDANGNVLGQHGLNTTLDFIINDTSIYQPTVIGYGLNPFNAFGTPTVTTANGVTISTYTFDNSNANYGPGHTVLLNTFDDIDPVIDTNNTGTNNIVYWSNSATGATNNHSILNGTANSAIVHNTTVNTAAISGSGTGWLNNNANITFEDGQDSSSAPIGLAPNS